MIVKINSKASTSNDIETKFKSDVYLDFQTSTTLNNHLNRISSKRKSMNINPSFTGVSSNLPSTNYLDKIKLIETPIFLKKEDPIENGSLRNSYINKEMDMFRNEVKQNFLTYIPKNLTLIKNDGFDYMNKLTNCKKKEKIKDDKQENNDIDGQIFLLNQTSNIKKSYTDLMNMLHILDGEFDKTFKKDIEYLKFQSEDIHNFIIQEKKLKEVIQFEENFIKIIKLVSTKLNRLSSLIDSKDKEINDLKKQLTIIKDNNEDLNKFILDNNIIYSSSVNNIYKKQADETKKFADYIKKENFVKNLNLEKEIAELNLLLSSNKEVEIENKNLYLKIDETEKKAQNNNLYLREEINRLTFKLQVKEGDILVIKLKHDKLEEKSNHLEREVKNLTEKVINEIKSRKLVENKLKQVNTCLEMSTEEKNTYYALYLNYKEMLNSNKEDSVILNKSHFNQDSFYYDKLNKR